jgi:Fic family protein
MMIDAETNIRILDAAYKAFPTFADWASQTSVDLVRWERYNASLNSAPRGPEVLERALQIAKRAAALDTGAIEGLYEVDRGFTYSVAVEASAWEVALAQKGEKVRPMFEAQLHAYDYVLDLATKAEPISEAAIRALHEEVCRAQDTYRVMTAVGPQEQPLPKGQYKVLPNHVRTRKSTDHSYAPVDVTPAEMARLVGEMRSEAFAAAHPVLQAAYAHYGLVAIHPFADGNGRVARALASTFTYRSISMPIVILVEHKNPYLDALEGADQGNYQVFVDFMLARSLDTIKLVDESVRAALAPKAEESLEAINGLYITKGGFTFEQVDKAGTQLLSALHAEVQKVMGSTLNSKVTGSAGIVPQSYQAKNSAYRTPMSGGQALSLTMGTASPAAVKGARHYQLWVPKDATGNDDILLVSGNGEFSARIEEIGPTTLSGVLQMRLKMLAERVVLELLGELSASAQKQFSKRF